MLVAKYFYTPASEDQMHIQRYLLANCSGDHVARRGIHISTRELLTLSMLVSLGGCDPQVKAHISGNLIVEVASSNGPTIDH
jgi:4-carboxymuconolactone decarboxylase